MSDSNRILTIEEAARCIQEGETEAEFMYRHAFYFLASSGYSLERATAYAEYAQGSIVQNPEDFAYWNHEREYRRWTQAEGAPR